MPSFNNLKELAAYIQKKANSALKNEVAETVIEEMQQQIEAEVYSVYEPKVYERQGYQGGLADARNIEVEVVNDTTISVENIRHDGDRDVAEIVETGIGYQYGFEYNGKPRRFTEETREALRNSDKLTDAIKRGLKRQGLKSE